MKSRALGNRRGTAPSRRITMTLLWPWAKFEQRAVCAERCTYLRPVHGGGLVHHSVRAVQYVSIRYSERLAEAGIEPSVGSVGDNYDALAKTVNDL
jgi:hypothetical protein